MKNRTEQSGSVHSNRRVTAMQFGKSGWSTTLLVVVIGALGASKALAQPGSPDYGARNFTYGGAPVSITWDVNGVPSVTSANDGAAFFGWGYAMAVDRFFQMEVARREMKGLQAELLGDGTLTLPDGEKLIRDPRQSDEKVRKLRVPYYLQKNLLKLQEKFSAHMALLQSFADGINHYLVEKLGAIGTWTGNINFPNLLVNVHPLFATFPLTGNRFQPWSLLDCLACLAHVSDPRDTNVFGPMGLLYAYRHLTRTDPNDMRWAAYYNGPPLSNLSHEQAVTELLGHTVLDEEAAAVKKLDVPLAQRNAINAYAQGVGWSSGISGLHGLPGHPDVPLPKFSHGIAAAGTRVSNNGGRAVVLAMPQLPASKMLFEAAVRGETFRARGVCFPGSPGFMVGFNEDVGWGITSAGSTGQLVYELRKGKNAAGEYDDSTYRFGNVKHTIVETTEAFPVRSAMGLAAWNNVSVTVRWAAAVTSTKFPEGLPIVTQDIVGGRLGAELYPDAAFQYVVLHPRYFVDSNNDPQGLNTAVAYIDMLRSEDVFDLKTSLLSYSNPACGMYAGDKEGNVAYWYLKRMPLHSASTSLSPMGMMAANIADNSSHLALDVVPNNFMPHVVNPRHQLVPGVRSPMEHIVVSGNSIAVGSWYPLPVYGGLGDSLRSLRFWQLLRAYPSNGSLPGSPDQDFTAEQILGFHYDDVDPAGFTFSRAALHQRTQAHDTFIAPTDSMLSLIESSNWVAQGGHMHSALPYTGGLTLMSSVMRSNVGLGDLCAEFGEAENGKCQLIKAIEGLYAATGSNPGDIFTALSSGNQNLRSQMKEFVEKSVGNGYNLATTGKIIGGTNKTHLELSTNPANWMSVFHSRYFNIGYGQNKNLKSSGARYRIGYHDDVLGYGPLDAQAAIDSNILHNANDGVGGQAFNFYTQWLRFHTPIIPSQQEHAVFNTGNSLHPGSPYFNNAQILWERDGLNFDLTSTQADPTRYFRFAPLP